MSQLNIPTPREIEQARHKIDNFIRETPVWEWKGEATQKFLPHTRAFLKLELFQFGGSFKIRGALMNMMGLSEQQLERGVTAVSAGNHAIGVAYAAQKMGTSAKVVMPHHANKLRVEKCKELGADVELVSDVHIAFERVEEIRETENRAFVHPFEGEQTTLGTATVGYEFHQQQPNLDAIIIPIGGGGLCAGIAAATKQINPECRVYGAEPAGAAAMKQSIEAGKTVELAGVDTIADSLAAPRTESYSFSLCQQFVDEVVTITDLQMAQTMRLMFEEMKLAVEPAAAAALGAAIGPLDDHLAEKNVGIIVCGTNIDIPSFNNIIDGTR